MELLLQAFSRSLPQAEIERIRREAQLKTAEDIMVTEVHHGELETPAEELARLMLRHDIDHIPILQNGVPVGVVSRHDFLRLIAGSSGKQ